MFCLASSKRVCAVAASFETVCAGDGSADARALTNEMAREAMAAVVRLMARIEYMVEVHSGGGLLGGRRGSNGGWPIEGFAPWRGLRAWCGAGTRTVFGVGRR